MSDDTLAVDDAFLVEPGWDRSDYIASLGGDGCRLLHYPDATVRLEHRCDRGQRGTVICAPKLAPEHQITYEDGRPTVAPSLHCPDCGLHGFITYGRWHR